MQGAHGALFVVEIEIGHDEVFLVQPLVVGLQKFGIVRHHGAVVVVGRVVLVQIIAFAGEEDEVHSPIQQTFDVAVGELGRVADGIAGDGVLALKVQLPRRLFAEHHREPAGLEKSRP